MSIDIEDRKRAEKELKANERDLVRIINITPRRRGLHGQTATASFSAIAGGFGNSNPLVAKLLTCDFAVAVGVTR